jgi:peptidoglycan/LPS O-acetylase OafA/YrhL
MERQVAETANRTPYRPEVDGLRAIAIIPVVLFHAGLNGFSGGYVGVDIFFVISGFLITSLIFREMEAGQFRFGRFWLRRARRLLPASYALVFTCMGCYVFIYPVVLFDAFAESILASTLFSSNILFWREGGYFSGALELQPLLHTWSLAVEEQYYLLYPAVLLTMHRFVRTHVITVLALICIASFALSIYASLHHSQAAFYLLPTRVWELGAGALIALTKARYTEENTLSFCNVVQPCGLVLILVAISQFDENTPFPSYYAMLPVLGTCLIIFPTNARALTQRVLCLQPLVFIGLISYSLYLWHWPVIVLKNWLWRHDTDVTLMLGTVVASFLLGTASYYLVEKPTRDRLKLSDSKLLVSIAVSTTLLLATSALALNYSNEIVVDPTGLETARYADAVTPERGRSSCTSLLNRGSAKVGCKELGNASKKEIDVFVWGDSHASALAPAFYKMAKQQRINVEVAANLGCQPVVRMMRVDQFLNCFESNQRVLEYIETNRFSVVVLVASFTESLNLGRSRDIDSDRARDPVSAMQEFGTNIARTVARIKAAGASVLVVTEAPRFPIAPAFEELRAKTLGLRVSIPVVTRESHEDRIRETYVAIDATSIDERLDFANFFCPTAEKCRYQYQGRYLYKDSSHLSNFAANTLSPKIFSKLQRRLRPGT